MENKIKQVVGIAFIENGKLLISQSHKSARNNKFTLVGGSIELGESILDAAVRECIEEIGNGFVVTKEDFVPLLDFVEHAASDPNLLIHMNILKSNKAIDVELLPNEEILKYHWYSIEENPACLSDSISKHLLPYLINNGLLETTKLIK